MAQLSTIVGSILRDMVLAQHQANMYAKMLSNVYSKDGALEHFPLPSIALGEMELDLHYGVVSNLDNTNASGNAGFDDSSDVQYEVNYVELPKIIGKLSDSFASVIFSTTNNTLRKIFPVESATDDNPLAKFDANPMLKNQIETFLSRKILENIRSEFPRLINESRGEIREKVLVACVINIGEKELLDHPEMKDIFEKQPDSKDKVYSAIENAVAMSSKTLLKDVNVMRRRLMPSAEVIVGSEALAKLPSDSIQRLHLKLTPKNITMLDKGL